MEIAPPDDAAVDHFWAEALGRTKIGYRDAEAVGARPVLPAPPAWSFGADRATADELVGLVLAGRKTATASALWEYEDEGVELPRPGDLSVVCDGTGQPCALVRTTAVEVRRFDQVGAAHAVAEGEVGPGPTDRTGPAGAGGDTGGDSAGAGAGADGASEDGAGDNAREDGGDNADEDGGDNADGDGGDDAELALASWRTAHEAFFTAALEEHGRTFGPDLQVVLERFELLYP